MNTKPPSCYEMYLEAAKHNNIITRNYFKNEYVKFLQAKNNNRLCKVLQAKNNDISKLNT
jgi:hypothetical protein